MNLVWNKWSFGPVTARVWGDWMKGQPGHRAKAALHQAAKAGPLARRHRPSLERCCVPMC